jgi:uncharacterized protein YoxC
MEQLNTALNGSINVIVVFTLLLLALSLISLAFAAMTIVPQINRTLGAFERLATTVEAELEPTLSEANKLLGGVLKLQNIAQSSVAGVQTKVEDVTGNLTKVADGAKKHTSVWGAGLAAGITAYLEGKSDSKDNETPKRSEGNKTGIDRGEKNVGLNR